MVHQTWFILETCWLWERCQVAHILVPCLCWSVTSLRSCLVLRLCSGTCPLFLGVSCPCEVWLSTLFKVGDKGIDKPKWCFPSLAIVSITWDPQKDRCPGPTPRDSDQFLWSVTWVSEFLQLLRCECAAVVESHVPESFSFLPPCPRDQA